MIALMLAAAAPITAAWQDPVALDRAVAAFVGRPAGSDGGARTPVDPRLRLAACPALTLSWRSATEDAVVVRCQGPEWRIFVPVRRATPTAPGPRPEAVGRLPAARAEPVIRRGDPVLIEAGTAGFGVSREGVAAADALPGAHFAVRVDGSARPIQAVATGPGRATLPGWDQ